MPMDGVSAPTGDAATLYTLAKELSKDGTLDAADQAAILDQIGADGTVSQDEREAAAKLLAKPEETVAVLQHHDLAFAAKALQFDTSQLAAVNARIDATQGGPKGTAVQGGGPTASATDVAKAEFTKHADTVYSLSDNSGTANLIRQSPQMDSLEGTTHDAIRCGGASFASALLLDSATPAAQKANAAAIRALAKDVHMTLSADQEKALTALAGGKMSPRNVAHLQELMFGLGSYFPGDASKGLNVQQVSSMLAGLRQRGGLSHATYYTFQLSKAGGAAHWTLTASNTPKMGQVVHVNTAPNAKGQAQLDWDRHQERGMVVDGQPSAKWGGEVELYNPVGADASVSTSIPSNAGNSPNYLFHSRDIDTKSRSTDFPIDHATLYHRDTHEPVQS